TIIGGFGNDYLEGAAGNDSLNGGDGDDQLNPGTGTDTVIGGAGRDELYISDTGTSTAFNINYTDYNSGNYQQIEDASIWTGSGNDYLNLSGTGTVYTDERGAYKGRAQVRSGGGNDTIIGGFGNDYLEGAAGNDILTGVNPTSTTPGRGEKDYLSGGIGADRFILGDATWVGYDDGNSTTNGSNDYAEIADFNATEGDVIQLQGTSSNYLLAISGADTRILIDKPGTEPDELIAIVKNQTGLSLTANYFVYNQLGTNITLALAPASVVEDGTTNLVYTFTRTGNIANALTVNYNVGGTAIFNTDYTQSGAASFTATTGTITFAAGSSTATLTIDPTADTTVESDETFALTLATGTDYTIGTTTAVTGTITNDDFPSITLAVSPSSVTEDGAANLVYTFTRTGPTTNALTVNYGITGTADSSDYTGATPGTGKTITFAAGSSTAILTIDPTADTTVESDETVALTLATGTAYTIGTTTAVTGTITNDDLPVITLAVSPASLVEDGTTNLVYTFTRTGPTTNALTVNYGITGTADSSDYTGATPGTGKTITFAAGASTAILTIDPTADTTVESDETVALTLATGTAYTIGTTTAVTGTITNDDFQPTINLSASQTLVEGDTSPQNASYTVTLSNASSQTITVNYATANGTATAGSDYTSTTGTLTFNPGVTSQVINIPILNDSINEANESFTLTLTSPTNASLGTTTTVTTTLTDTLTASVTTTLPANVENLTLTGTAAINGTGNAGDNILIGNSANNTLSGGDGNDTYAFLATSALGTDTITETTTGGTDTLDFTGTTAAVNVNLGVTTSQTVNSNLKLIFSANNVIENATGGTGNDRITGNTLNNTLIGGDGNDQLQGLAGNDNLTGGSGNDILTGGSGDDLLSGELGDDILTGGVGQDKYIFQSNAVFSTSLGVDYITEFEVGSDSIVLSKTTFNAVTNTVGQALTDFEVVSDDEFVNASNGRIVYSQSTGSLFYNQDGNVLGTGTVFEFARLGNLDITLSASNFTLIA
ncbi:MAG: beta strand repeat-containing protein, partial [Gloeotrichia echinulata HAB0833]